MLQLLRRPLGVWEVVEAAVLTRASPGTSRRVMEGWVAPPRAGVGAARGGPSVLPASRGQGFLLWGFSQGADKSRQREA